LEETINYCVDLYNHRVHSSTGVSPFAALRPVSGYSPIRNVTADDLQQLRLQQALKIRALYDGISSNLDKNGERMKKKHARRNHAKLKVFSVGDVVLIKTPKKYHLKSNPRWRTEAVIVKVHRNNRFVIRQIFDNKLTR